MFYGMPKHVPIGFNHHHHIKSSVASIQRWRKNDQDKNIFNVTLSLIITRLHTVLPKHLGCQIFHCQAKILVGNFLHASQKKTQTRIIQHFLKYHPVEPR